MVKKLTKSPKLILESLSPHKVHLLHMASKLCSEAGEIMDAIGKHIYYEKDLDLENILEELGDIEYYLEGLRQGVKISRDSALKHNIKKLSIRYKGFKYSNKAAIKRADKQ